MNNKVSRIGAFLAEFDASGEFSAQTICRKLDISKVTLGRYLRELKKNGYCIKRRKGMLHLVKAGLKPTGNTFKKADYTSFRVLMVIFNNNPCSRALLKRSFCSDTEDKVSGFISEKTLDIHLRRLLEQGFIIRKDGSGEVSFVVSDAIVSEKNFDFKKALYIINYLKIYGDTLPFREIATGIAEKLEVACINHLRKSIDAAENVLFTRVVFPDCVMEKNDRQEEVLACELEAFCLEGRPVRIKMKQGSMHEIVPFIVVFNWYMGCWYLVGRHTTDDDGFDLFRLDRMESYDLMDMSPAGQKDINSRITAARTAIESSFQFSVEEETNVTILFLNPTDIELEEINDRMRNAVVNKREVTGSGTHVLNIDIKGTTDFLSWVRKFGSKAYILNEDLRQKHLGDAMAALEKYAGEGWQTGNKAGRSSIKMADRR